MLSAFLTCSSIGSSVSNASAVAQGTVVRAMSASYRKCLNLALHRNLIPQHITAKTGMIDDW
jgi:hypothetical protein